MADPKLYAKVLKVVFDTCEPVEGVHLDGETLHATKVNGKWPLVPDPVRVIMLLFGAPHECTFGGHCGEPAVAAHWHGHHPTPGFDGFYCPKHIDVKAKWMADVPETLNTCTYVRGEGRPLREKYSRGR